MQKIHVNPVSPQALLVTCTPSSSLPDMTQVESAVLQVKKPDRSVATWEADIREQTAESLILRHLFVLGDVDQVGSYSVYPVHTLPIGSVRGSTQQFQAVDDFG